MMGHRAKLISGDEWDALTRGKRFYKFREGDRRKIKAKFNRRQRALDRLVAHDEANNLYT